MEWRSVCVCLCVSVCAMSVCVFGYVLVGSERGWKQRKTLAKSYGTSVDTRKIQLPINLRQQPPTQVSRRDLSELFLLDLPFGSHDLCRSFVWLTFKLYSLKDFAKRKCREKKTWPFQRWNQLDIIYLFFLFFFLSSYFSRSKNCLK